MSRSAEDVLRHDRNHQGYGREQTSGEELANALSHGLGCLAALIAAPILIVRALAVGDAAFVAGVCVFTATTIFLYLASTLYHALPAGPAKRVFWVLDHAGIYLLIAGTYTPFTLGILGGPRGWLLFGLVWAVAAAGVLAKVLGRRIPEAVSTASYLGLGWIVLVAVDLVLVRVPPAGLAWLVAGGLAYSFGIVFFALDRRMPFGHFVWHLFVLAGTGCHAIAVYGYGV